MDILRSGSTGVLYLQRKPADRSWIAHGQVWVGYPWCAIYRISRTTKQRKQLFTPVCGAAPAGQRQTPISSPGVTTMTLFCDSGIVPASSTQATDDEVRGKYKTTLRCRRRRYVRAILESPQVRTRSAPGGGAQITSPVRYVTPRCGIASPRRILRSLQSTLVSWVRRFQIRNFYFGLQPFSLLHRTIERRVGASPGSSSFWSLLWLLSEILHIIILPQLDRAGERGWNRTEAER